MREIKFRAWDERNKIMHFDFMFIKSGDEGNDWIIFSSDKNKNYDQYIKNPYFRQQLKIMQYTGLKDKNGKEIYEGDIVKYLFWDRGAIYEIRWVEESCQFIGDGRIGLFTDSNDRYEVIGNIYENKELLKND